MEIVKSVDSLRSRIAQWKERGRSTGLVPTMGALHRGHISLVEQSREQCGATIVSIFVNPTQFAPNEDLQRYPRTLEADIGMLEQAGADLVFAPDATEIYPDGCTTAVLPPVVSKRLEGEFRPTHFQGVCTIVLKLLNMAAPDRAYFGQKDYQQACVVRQMAMDLNVPVAITVCPVIRDDDGLALSSRNAFLTVAERGIALSLNQSLIEAAARIRSGESDGHELMAAMRQQLIDGGVDSVDYAVIADPDTLEIMDRIVRPAVLLVAAHVGGTRLIDNVVVE